MPAGLRAADAPQIQQLCQGDKGLLMRVGALLQSQLCVTEAVLEEISYSPQIRKLLMDRSLKDCDSDSFASIVDRHACQDSGLQMSAETDGWRCLHLEDEVGNLFAEEAATRERDDGHEQHWQQSVNDLLPTLHSSVRTPLEGLLSAQGDDQRAAAIEQLRYASPSLSVVSELMPVILADGADVVRERGIGLLTAAGASPVVTDIIRALQRNDTKTLDRLQEHVPRLPYEQKELIFAALIASASRGDLSNAMVQLSSLLADVIAHHRGLSRYLELLLLHGTNMSLVKFVRLLQDHNPETVNQLLHGFLGQSTASDARILVLLANDRKDFTEDLMRLGVEFLLSRQEEPRDRMGLANALRRMNTGQELAQLIASQAHELEHTRDSTVYWLLSELSRNQLIAVEDANLISDQIRLILRRGDGPHTVSILDQQLPALLPCDAGQRQRMVEPLAELLARFRDERSQDQINTCLTLMGDAAIEPLWRIITSHPKAEVRIACVNILPTLLADKNEDEKHEAIQVLRQESKLLSDQQHKGLFYLSAAILLHQVEDDRGVCEQLNQDCAAIGSQTIDASAWLVASKHIQPDRRLKLIEYMLNLINAELPEGTNEETVDPGTEEITYILDANLSMHTDLVPRALRGLEIICDAPGLPPQLLRRISISLINQWRKVSRWEVIWGPANIHQLAQSLAAIASRASYPESMRIQVAEALATRSNQIKIAEFLIGVFQASKTGRIYEIASKVVLRILKNCNDNQYAEDEYGELAYILAHFLTLPELDTYADHIYIKIARTISMYQSHCSIRTREYLQQHLTDFETPIRDQFDWLTP